MTVTVGADTTKADLKLNKVGPFELVDQLMPAEVEASLPGTTRQKIAISICGDCHSLSRVLKSTHDASEFKSVIVRMRNHEPAANDTHPINLPYYTGQRPQDEELAKYLASINLSSKSQWDYELKPFPRPKGNATRVIYTEYDLPRPEAEPHDVIMDSEGMIWYIDFAEAIVGRLDPRTGETKEWPLPEIKPGFAPGSLGLALDKEGNPWIARSFQGGIAKFDKKTEKATGYRIPPEYENVRTRTSFIDVGPDDKVMFDDTLNRRIYIMDPATGKMITYPLYPGFKWDVGNDPGAGQGNGDNHSPYGVAISSKGVGYWGDLGNRNIGEIELETGKTVLYPTPTPSSGPRRMNMATDDQLWFAENASRKIAVFDTKTKQFKEWDPPCPYDAPYDVISDKQGYAWTGGMPTDYVTRLNPKTGEMVNYLLPNANVNIRRVSVDNFTNPPSMLFGENHQAKIILVQALN
jgi:streptogramin lyase